MTNYQSGVRFERERKAAYEDLGYTVLRTAGSHGPYDLVCVREGYAVLLIQCKLVKDETTAKRTYRQWVTPLPLDADRHYVQLLEIRIKGNTELYHYEANS